MDGPQKTGNVSQEPLVSGVIEKMHAMASMFSSSFSPSTSSTKRVNPLSKVEKDF